LGFSKESANIKRFFDIFCIFVKNFQKKINIKNIKNLEEIHASDFQARAIGKSFLHLKIGI
jgi:hypothetical protein